MTALITVLGWVTFVLIIWTGLGLVGLVLIDLIQSFYCWTKTGNWPPLVSENFSDIRVSGASNLIAILLGPITLFIAFCRICYIFFILLSVAY